MALQMNYRHPQLDVLSYNAYWRINPINGIVGGKDRITYTIDVFKNAEMAHVKNSRQIQKFSYSFVPDCKDGAPNFIKQAYLNAKTQALFSGSVDV
jgi:hypothetical protein